MADGQAPVRVVFADDHPLFRAAIAALCDVPEIDLVAVAEDGEAAFALVLLHEPDVAVLDVEMPGANGPQVARRIADAGLHTRVLFLSAHQQGHRVYDALADGGHGYVGKDAPSDVIRDAILRVAGGGAVLTPTVGAGVIGEIQERARRAAPALSERETAVLGLAGQGATIAEMAAKLYLSPATVKTHLATLYAKLGVADRPAAIAEAARRGLLS